MPTHHATCTLCEATCGIEVETDGDRVVAIRGDASDPFSRGYICPKATALADLHTDPDRLRQPVKKVDGQWQTIGWDQALSEIAARVRQVRARHGRHAVGIYQGNPSVHSLGMMTYGQLLWRRLRTRNTYSATSSDQLPHMLSSLTMFGHQLLLPVPDVDRTDFFLMLGANPLASNGSLMTAPDMRGRLKALRGRGGTLVVVDPRRTETARVADRHLFIRPGTDALLLLALVHTVLAEKLASPGRLAAHAEGLADIERLAARFSPERVAGAVGITADDIRALARDFCAAERAVCYGRLGVCTQAFGGLSSWLINVLNFVTGNLDRAGGAMFTTPAIDLVAATARIGMKGSFDRYRSPVRDLPEFGGELPVSVLADHLETPGPMQIRALFTSAGNPVLSAPNGARLERALPGLDLMVSLDLYINETTRHADYILPPTAPLERSHYDIAFNALAVRNVAKYAPAVFPRGPEQRHDWEICLALAALIDGRPQTRALAAIARRLGPEAVLELGLRAGPYGRRGLPGGLSLRRLRRSPHGVDLGPLVPRLPDTLHTADGRIQLAPAVYLADVARLERSLGAPAGLRLIGRRHLRSNNSWLHNSQRLVKGKPRCTLLMHPDDAAARQLADGDTAEVSSRTGTIALPVEISEDIMPGVVSIPHGWGHDRDGVELRVAREHAGVSLNDITDETHLDALSGNAGFSGVTVEIRRAAASAPRTASA